MEADFDFFVKKEALEYFFKKNKHFWLTSSHEVCYFF